MLVRVQVPPSAPFFYNITMFGGNNLLHITEIPISFVCFLHCIAFFLGHFGLFSINFMMLNLLNNQIIHDLFVIFGIFFGTLIYISNTKKGFIKVLNSSVKYVSLQLVV